MKFKNFWEANFLRMELLTALALSLALFIWLQVINGGYLLTQILLDIRATLYGALVALFGSLLGFIITSVSIILGYANSDRLEIVRKSKHYKDLWAVFESAIKVLTLATITALFGLIFDKNNKPVNNLIYINVFTTLLSFFRIARCIWVIENIIKIVTKPIN